MSFLKKSAVGVSLKKSLLHGVKFLGVEGVSPSDFEDRL